jgi:hypothetical protein
MYVNIARCAIKTEIDRSIVGISFGVSLAFIFLAFNIRWVTTPWNYLRHIGIKVLLIILLKPLRNSKSLRVWSKGYNWIFSLIWSLTEYEFTSQLDRAWIAQAFRATRPVSVKKYYAENGGDQDEYSGVDADIDADTEDSLDEDMEKKTALLKHLGGVYKKPQRRKLS